MAALRLFSQSSGNRDCMNRNIMMDPKPTFPSMYHPVDIDRTRDFKGRAKYHTRTARPTKYFLIDFGLSRKYNPDDGTPAEIPILGGDKTVPEFQDEGEYVPSNPFPTDIYYIGNMIREDFLQVSPLPSRSFVLLMLYLSKENAGS